MLKKDAIISFDEFLLDNFAIKNREEAEIKIDEEKINTTINKKSENQIKGSADFESALNKFFPGDYKSSIDFNDTMVKKWTSVFDELKTGINKDGSKSKKETIEVIKSIDKCKKVSFKLHREMEINKNGSAMYKHDMSWVVQLAAVSMVVFALSTVFFNANPGFSKNVLEKISTLGTSNISTFAFNQQSQSNLNTQAIQQKIEITKEELSAYIKNNYDSLNKVANKTIVEPSQITGRVAGVSEVREIEEKRAKIYDLLDEGERLIFEMLKNILHN